MEIPQPIQKTLRKELFACQVIQVSLGEMEIFQIIDGLFQTGADGESATVRDFAKEHIENCPFVLQAHFQIAVGHG